MALADMWDDLDQFLGEDMGAAQGEDQAWVIGGQEEADRALRRLARLAREERDIRQVAQAERDRITAWERDRMAGVANRRQWISDGLEGFMRAVNARSGAKSLSLPWGTLRLRKTQPRVDVLDALALAAAAPELVEMRPAPDKAAIKRRFTPGPALMDHPVDPGFTAHAAVNPDGEQVPGVVLLVPDQESFSATPMEDDR